MGWGALGCSNLTAFGARGGVARDVTNGHTSNKCNIKHFGVPNRKYHWVPVHK